MDALELATKLIYIENNLVDHRITWLLVFQGILFGVFFRSIELLEPKRLTSGHRELLLLGVVILCIVAALSALAAAISISAAESQIEAVLKWGGAQEGIKSVVGKDLQLATQGFPLWVGISLMTSHVVAGLAIVWAILLVLFAKAAR
jgi:hypothetical protein